jgi:hypothetical protein
MTGSGARLIGARPRQAWRPSPTESGSMVPSFHSGNPAVDQPLARPVSTEPRNRPCVGSVGTTLHRPVIGRSMPIAPFIPRIVSAIDEKHQCRPGFAAIASTIDEARPPAPDSQPPTSQGHHTADMRFSAPDDPGCATGLYDPPQGSRIRPDAGRRATGAK